MMLGGGGGLVGLVVALLLVFSGLGAVVAAATASASRARVARISAPSARPAPTPTRARTAAWSRSCRSVQEYWQSAVRDYRPAETVLFAGQVATGCGNATSAVGPFYCPADEHVYVDLGFFDELQLALRRVRVGRSRRPTSSRTSTGITCRTSSAPTLGSAPRPGPKSGSVRLELQADCYAGVWAAHAEQTRIVEDITDQDIADGLSAAAAVGDDRIQEAATGRVDRESFTHGTARQRQKWFSRGFRTGDPASCDTFASDAL